MKLIHNSLEKMINTALRYDCQAAEKIKTFHGKLVHVHMLDLNMDMCFEFVDDKIYVRSNIPASVDLMIKGTPSAFILFASGKAKNSEITLKGDTELARALQDFFKSLDIDLAEPLSSLVGDIAAHRLASTAKKLGQFAKQTALGFKTNFGEYLTEESRLSPTKFEVDEFTHQVNTLRDDVARLSARINRLTRREAT